MTLVDESRKTVALTLWREQASELGAQLAALRHPVIAFSKLRVGDFGGLSLSGTYNTRAELEPQVRLNI